MSQAKPNLVLVPGSLCDERVWMHQSEALADVADIVIPHLHGHDSLIGMAQAILAEAPATFALCGFSMGGRAALEVFRLAPERIARLALIDASIHPVAEGEAARRQPQIDMAHKEGMAALARWWNPKITSPTLHEHTAFMDLLESMACSFSPDDYAKEVAALLNRPDPRGLLGDVAVPTLVLAGANDPLSTPERNRSIADAITGATLVSVPDAWHFPMLEKPDAVTAALRDWLQS